MQLAKRALLIALALSMTACGINSRVPRHTLYQGEAQFIHLGDLSLRLEDNSDARFSDVFTDFRVVEGIFPNAYPLTTRIEISKVDNKQIGALLDRYDANNTGYAEVPELTVLYIVEGARGLGTNVSQVGATNKIDAIVTSTSDVAGLAQSIYRNIPSMTPQAQAIFAELKRQAYEERFRRISERDGGKIEMK